MITYGSTSQAVSIILYCGPVAFMGSLQKCPADFYLYKKIKP